MSDCGGSQTRPGCALTLLLLDAARAVEARAEIALSEVGLSLAKLGALRHLVIAAEPLSLSHLAERHCCGKSNVTQLVDRLAADGFVARVADPDDRRKVVYSLSAKGEALLPVVLALRQWGEDWGHGKQDIMLADQRDGAPIQRIAIHAQDGRELTLRELMWIERTTGASLKRPASA